jgi:hypothetical protein
MTMPTLMTRLTEPDLDKCIEDKVMWWNTFANTQPTGCNGDCDQGRKACDCRPDAAEACTEVGAEPAGQHRTSPLIRAYLMARRWLF